MSFLFSDFTLFPISCIKQPGTSRWRNVQLANFCLLVVIRHVSSAGNFIVQPRLWLFSLGETTYTPFYTIFPLLLLFFIVFYTNDVIARFYDKNLFLSITRRRLITSNGPDEKGLHAFRSVLPTALTGFDLVVPDQYNLGIACFYWYF